MAHKIKLPSRRKKLRALETDLQAYDMTTSQAVKKCVRCLNLAIRMAEKGKDRVNTVYSMNKNVWISCWNKDPMLTKWFGDASQKSNVKDVHSRILSVSTRLSKGISIRLRPNSESSPLAQNAGWFMEPKTFKVFSRLLSKSDEYVASVFVHELIHLWFTDQKLNGEKVYGKALAMALADDNPRKARRSAENYESFVDDLW
jgi:hypothetical protein